MRKHCSPPRAYTRPLLFSQLFGPYTDIDVGADIGSGLYHFGVDNYGSKDTPVVGSQIAAFQGMLLSSTVITDFDPCSHHFACLEIDNSAFTGLFVQLPPWHLCLSMTNRSGLHTDQ